MKIYLIAYNSDDGYGDNDERIDEEWGYFTDRAEAQDAADAQNPTREQYEREINRQIARYEAEKTQYDAVIAALTAANLPIQNNPFAQGYVREPRKPYIAPFEQWLKGQSHYTVVEVEPA